MDRLLGEHGIRRDNSSGRREFARRMEARRRDGEEEDALKTIRRGWRFGAGDFLERLGERMKPASLDSHAADQVRDQQRLSAATLIRRELAKARIGADGCD